MNIADIPWLLKRSSGGAAEIGVLLTPVDGKVFELQKKRTLQKEQQKNIKDPEKVLAADFADGDGGEFSTRATATGKSKAKSKAKAKVKAKSKASGKTREIEDETREAEELTISGPNGLTLSRPKLFVDDVVLSFRSAMLVARKQQGLPYNVESSSLLCEDGEYMKYMNMEIPLLKAHVRAGLMFAMQGEVMVGKKVHKKWSSLRPALQTEAIGQYTEAHVGTQKWSID